MEKRGIPQLQFCESTTEGSALVPLSAISSHLLSLGYPEKSLKSALKCGELTGFRFLKHCSNCGDTHLISCKHHCNLRVCPDCSITRQNRIKRLYMPFLEHYSTKRGKLKSLYFLTIAPKNYKTEKEGFEHIKRSWRKFIRTKYIKERVDGGLWVIETKNMGNGWHTHIHALFYGRRLDNCIRGKCLNCGQNYMKYDRNSKKYYCKNRKCNSTNVVVKENSKIVDLFSSCSSRECHIDVTEIRNGPKAALSYVLKYISSIKEDFSEVEDFAKYIVAIRKQKLINTFGCFFDITKKIKDLKKIKFKCNKCGGDLEFITDQQVVYYFTGTPCYDPPDDYFERGFS